MDFAAAQQGLVSAGIEIAPGLTDAEFASIERSFNFQFPPDLREFLSIGLPISNSWVNSRASRPKHNSGQMSVAA